MWWRVPFERFVVTAVGAAPHPPAGTFSPLNDGEKFAVTRAVANAETLTIGEIINETKLLPVLTGRRCRQADEGRRLHLKLGGAH